MERKAVCRSLLPHTMAEGLQARRACAFMANFGLGLNGKAAP